MSFNIDVVTAHAGLHMGLVIRLLYEGVAFRKDGTTFEIFSHEGDELGLITTADLSFAINFVKRTTGRAVGKCKHHQYDPVAKKFSDTYEPAFTFAWEGWHALG